MKKKEEGKKKKEEVLGVPPVGVGLYAASPRRLRYVPLRSTALRLLWAFRCYPSRGYAILRFAVNPCPPITP
jgi:hypothetical protein